MSNPYAAPPAGTGRPARLERSSGSSSPWGSCWWVGSLVRWSGWSGRRATGDEASRTFADAPVDDAARADPIYGGLTDPWRRGDLQIGVDGGNYLDPWPMDAPSPRRPGPCS
ncbi:hypothetical protein NKG05_23030 [Oerskovia sp. M15]